MNQASLSALIWSVADLLRGDYKQSEYGKVILPFTVLRRLDCVLEPTKAAVLAEHAAQRKKGLNAEPFLLRKAKLNFYNISPMDMKKLMGDQDTFGKTCSRTSRAFPRRSAISSSTSSFMRNSTASPKPGCSIW
jgi:type I restriction enzyme M protein